MRFQVLYEDNHLIAVNKPGGTLVQGDATGDKTLGDQVKNYIKHKYKKPGDVFLGTIHRLDRPVSGVVVFARTSKALERMNKLFRDREVKKTYWAITNQQPDPIAGTLVDYIFKNSAKNKATALDRVSNRHPDAKRSELSYSLIGRIGHNVLLEVDPLTGRPHQIRVQLAKIGCAIRGDVKYGFHEANRDQCIHLHCRSLDFVHPVKKEPVHIFADPNQKDDVWREFRGHWTR